MSFKKNIIFLAIISIISGKFSANESTCGDWHPFKGDKCFKIFDKVQSYNEANTTCKEQDNTSSLITIRYKEEQDFIDDFLKNNGVSDNVWIGAGYTINKYKWNDGTEVIFTNWGEGSPLNKTDRCIQLQTDDHSYGKWSEVLCTKRNLVVCQKRQAWSISHLQDVLINAINNPFPIGFIYVQLPKENPPSGIWPWMIWRDISDEYADVFFRVSGKKTATFGERQEESSPRLTSVNTQYLSTHANENHHTEPTNIIKGVWSPWMWTGTSATAGVQLLDTRFLVSNEEVRPLNMAIRIWKRTG